MAAVEGVVVDVVVGVGIENDGHRVGVVAADGEVRESIVGVMGGERIRVIVEDGFEDGPTLDLGVGSRKVRLGGRVDWMHTRILRSGVVVGGRDGWKGERGIGRVDFGRDERVGRGSTVGVTSFGWPGVVAGGEEIAGRLCSKIGGGEIG